jgi:putative transposase
MRGPKPPSIQLSPRPLALLQRLIRRRSAPQQLVCRARLILLASEGLNNSQIGHQLHLYRGQVRHWRTRWLAAAPHLTTAEAADPDDQHLTRAIEDLLADAPRPGTPPRFTPEQVVQIVALACERPQESGRPISHWTPRELADEAQKRGIVHSISARSVGRFLK